MTTSSNSPRERNPWLWIPSLYLVQGLPYTMVALVSVIMYKRLGISNADIALYTSWLYLPWVIKPFWSPVVDLLKTRRLWIWITQLIIGGGLAGVALTIPAPKFFQWTLAFFWLLAFSSATHDIAADGFYMMALSEKRQSFFVGVRSTFFRIALIFGQGLLVILAGVIERNTGLPPVAVQVASRPDAALIQSIDWSAPEALSTWNELRLVVPSKEIIIRSESRPGDEVASLIAAARNQNSEGGFNHSREAFVHTGEPDSFWKRYLARPTGNAFHAIGGVLFAPFRALGRALEPFLRKHFGPDHMGQPDRVGNIGYTTVHLSRPPEDEITVTVTPRSGGFLGFFKTGSKSVSIVEGARLVFDKENWSTPAVIVFQLDPQSRGELTAGFEVCSGNIPLAWSITIGMLAALLLACGIYHKFVLPRPATDHPGAENSLSRFFKEFMRTFGSFFRKPGIAFMLLFLLCYRFAEAQLVKLAAPFLLDAREVGGLALTTGQVGFVYGTVGVVALTVGGLLGGFVAARYGLKRWIWWMAIAINLPNAVYVYLSRALPESLWVVNLCVAVEQFGYGFGFAAYLLYMIYIARGEHKTAHYAICTGFMALGMMLPGMFTGWLQEIIGYQNYFVWVMLATIPAFVAVKLIPLDPDFGRKTGTT